MFLFCKQLEQFRFRLYSLFFFCLRRGFRHAGCGVRVGRHVYWESPRRISIGDHCLIKRDTSLCGGAAGGLILGDSCEIAENCLIRAFNGRIRFGRRSSLNFCGDIVGGAGGVEIGNDVRIGPHCVLIASEHNWSDPERPIVEQGTRSAGIVIEDDVWIGAHVTILDGVRIGTGCVVGAGAVVSRSLPPFSVAVGVPARVLKSRRRESDE